jgi:hypothetical protein
MDTIQIDIESAKKLVTFIQQTSDNGEKLNDDMKEILGTMIRKVVLYKVMFED